LGFVSSISDTSLFVYKSGAQITYLLLYVDDIVLIASSFELLHEIISRLHDEFAMIDLGTLHYFLNMLFTRSLIDYFFLSDSMLWISPT
jgi:hypothetical protein